jgi:hypothetical protein
MVEVRGQSQGPSHEWYEPRRSKFSTVVGVAFRGETYRHAAYLLLTLPLGIIYFALTMAVLSVGGGLAVALIGLVILGAAIFAWPVVAEMERRLSNHMLRTRIDPLTFNEPDGPGLWPQIVARLTSVSTWQSLLYLAVRLPIGVVAFVVTVVSFPLALVTATMSLHLVNATARLVARINRTLLQPWAAPVVAHADAYTSVARPPARPVTADAAGETEPVQAPVATAAEPAASTTPSAELGPKEPFADKAQKATANFTDRVQEITDELGERVRAAARGWNQPEAMRSAAPATSPPAAERETTTTAPESEPTEGASADGDDSTPSRVTVDVAMRIVTVNEQDVELTPKEFDLLVLFVSNPGRPFSRDELLDRIWRNDYEVTDRTIDTHIQRLRKKLGPAAELIQTVWGVGYKYQPPRE